VPVEADIPEAFLHDDTVIVGRITTRPGNWRYAAENGFDDAHAKYLHRYGSLWTMFKVLPGWSTCRIVSDGTWITRQNDTVGYETEYPGLGRWPRLQRWNRVRGRGHLSIRLPGCLRSQYETHAHYEWYVPVDRERHRYLQFLVTRATGKDALEYRLRYWLYRRWLFHGQFNSQDASMVELMPEMGPERLFRPDVSITAWRRLCEHARGAEAPAASLAEQLAAEATEADDAVPLAAR
jgi:phenylpropionate dioxygenase-like ring-hydroxylating dioxygenase large terminal subunit